MKKINSIILFKISVVLLFSRCASPLFVSEQKWKDMRSITINSNESNVNVINKYGESFGYLEKGNNNLRLDYLNKYNTTLTFKHPNRKDTTIVLKRKVRGGAFWFDFFIFYPAIVYDFVTADMYKLKRSSKVINLEMEYSNDFYLSNFNQIKNTKNPSDYLTYINNYPKSPYIITIKQKMYDLAYNNSISENTIESFEKHNIDYPESPYKNDIQNKLYDLGFQQAVKANTPEAFDNYIAKYPNTPKLEEAKKAKNRVKEIDDAFANANSTNTYKSYQAFLDNYPETKYTSQIAEKAANNYCTENLPKLSSLNMCNDVCKRITRKI